MHIFRTRMGIWQLGQFKVVRREQGKAFGALYQVFRNCPGQRQSVKCRGAATDFIHQHQRVFCGAMQDGCRFCHLYHEGGTSSGQIVCCTNTGENSVDRAYACAVCRYIATHISEQGDQGDLTHKGRFTTHIRAGNQ